MDDTGAKGKVALITGAARGIGLNIARRLASEGLTVWISDVDGPAGEAAERALRAEGANATFIRADLCRADAAAGMVHGVIEASGRLDLLVNNAKAGIRTNLQDETEANWDLAFSVIAKASFFASRAALDDMKKRGSGAIVNMSSVAASVTTHDAPSYHAAKAALVQLTRYLASYSAPYGVRVNCVVPGFIVQDQHRPRFESDGNVAYRSLANAAHPMRRTGYSDEIAEAVLFLGSERSSFINGQALVVDGGLTLQEPFNLALRLQNERGRGK